MTIGTHVRIHCADGVSQQSPYHGKKAVIRGFCTSLQKNGVECRQAYLRFDDVSARIRRVEDMIGGCIAFPVDALEII